MSSTTGSRPARLARTLVAAAVVATGSVVCLAGPAPARPDDRAERWVGYPIARTGQAAGGWIGGYRIGRTPVFVVTPERRPNHAGFRAVEPTSDLQGRKGPSRRDTQRAAWILSRYGGYKDAVQAAAVDAAVLHLVADREWRLDGARGARRVAATADPATVRRYVRLMLSGSRASAGRYHVAVVPDTADAGGVTSVTVRVTDGHGGPVAGLPVSVTSPDGGASQPATGPVEAVTGDDGRALVRLAAPLAGWRTVTARVGQVPEHRLRVRGADRKGQAAVAEGGVRRTVVASARVGVRGPQALTLSPVPASLSVGALARVAATVSGDGTARAATAGLHGPFATASAAGCSGSPVGSVSMTVPGDGTHTFPPVSPTAGGYYAWRVEVAGSPTSIPAAACGAVVKVRARPTLQVAAPGSAPIGNVNVPVTVSGIPFAMRVDLTLKLFGPGDTNCSSPIADVDLSRLGDGQAIGTIWVDSAGTYSWQVSADPGDLWQGASSPCGGPGTSTTVG